MTGKCSQCKKKKELVNDHGTCWKCHIASLSIQDKIIARKK